MSEENNKPYKYEHNEYDEKALKLSRKAYNNKKDDYNIAVKVLKGCLDLLIYTSKMTGHGVSWLYGAMTSSSKIISKRKREEEDNA
jgi:hypothetical protein